MTPKGALDPRIPPQDLDMERALLGALMLNQNSIYEVADVVTVDSFYAGKHRTAFDAMLSLHAKGEPIDLVTVSGKLKERKQLQDIGGASYLSELIGSAASPGSARHYAEAVQTKFVLRSLIDAASKIGELGFQEDRDIETILDEAQAAVFQVSNAPSLRTFTTLKESLGEAWERLEHLQKHESALRGIPTGFPQLDSLLAGFQKSDLIILAARPSMGKTALALDIARQTATKHGTAVGIFSLEMSSQQLVDRMLASEARVDSWQLRTGKIKKDDDFGRLQEAMSRLSEAPIYIDDKATSTVLAMRSVARRLKMEKDLGLIIVDYLQLITPSFVGSNTSMVQQVTEISRSLKAMARELDTPVLALSQLSRAVEQRRGRPRLSDLRDSGCLAGETLIVDAKTGARRTIKELADHNESMQVFGLDDNFRVSSHEAVRFFPSGKKQLYRLTMRSGRSIRASGNHPFKTLSGWNRLDFLEVGDHVAVPRSLDVPTSSDAISSDEAVLLAHLLGDGCILPGQPYHYTTASPKNQQTVVDAARRLFGITSKTVRQKNWTHVYFTSPYRLARGKKHPITLWFERLGIERVRSYQKRIPEVVFASSKERIALFLKHVWSTDGNVSEKRLSARKPSASIYYASSSRKLAEQVAHLLLRIDIRSVVRQVPSAKGYRMMYHAHVEGTPDQLRFLEVVGMADERMERIPSYIKALREISPNTNIDTVPKEAWRLVVTPAKDNKDMSWRDIAKEMNLSYNGTALMRTGISRGRLATIGALLASEKCLELATSDVLWDRIVSVETDSVEDVYDATVPGVHNFVANDIIVHNSIEQDADVVMFIHRDDKMNDNSERPGVAEILVEKHRNGPTGKIELQFQEKMATFDTLASADFGDFTPETAVESGETPF